MFVTSREQLVDCFLNRPCNLCLLTLTSNEQTWKLYWTDLRQRLIRRTKKRQGNRETGSKHLQELNVIMHSLEGSLWCQKGRFLPKLMVERFPVGSISFSDWHEMRKLLDIIFKWLNELVVLLRNGNNVTYSVVIHTKTIRQTTWILWNLKMCGKQWSLLFL